MVYTVLLLYDADAKSACLLESYALGTCHFSHDCISEVFKFIFILYI